MGFSGFGFRACRVYRVWGLGPVGIIGFMGFRVCRVWGSGLVRFIGFGV